MIVDIINKKRMGEELTYQELDYFFNGYLNGEIADYQMSSLLMAICINGMTDEETFALTKLFIDSGDVLDFSDIPGVKIDKHSTGGIGDKTSLIIAPIVAACGGVVIKMSGRGLGYTGGTIDKLESIPGMSIDLSEKELKKQVKNIHLVITGQTGNLVPMDKVIYALRDVTGTVSSIPLIASSVMSKKIASGADKILIDIKVGNGAFLQSKKDAKKLEELMVKIGNFYNREVRCVISDMNVPLGSCIGNSLEVLEAIQILKGEETHNNLVDLCYELSSIMVSMIRNIDEKEARKLVEDSISSLEAYHKFEEMVKAQNGDLSKIKVSNKTMEIKSTKSGIINDINALEIGKLSLALGAGRVKKSDKIDYTVGVKLVKFVGDEVKKGDTLAILYYKNTVPNVSIDTIFNVL